MPNKPPTRPNCSGHVEREKRAISISRSNTDDPHPIAAETGHTHFGSNSVELLEVVGRVGFVGGGLRVVGCDSSDVGFARDNGLSQPSSSA